MRSPWLFFGCALWLACSSGGKAPVTPPDTGRDAGSTTVEVPDAGSTEVETVEPTGPAYRVVELRSEPVPYGSPSILDMSPGGLVLVSAFPAAPWVYDPKTGTRREVPQRVEAINDAGVTAGIRTSGSKLPPGDCDEREVFLHFPDGTIRGLGNPARGLAAERCMEPGSSMRAVRAVDGANRVLVDWDIFEEGTFVTAVFLFDGAAWHRLPSLGGHEDQSGGLAKGLAVGRTLSRSLPDAPMRVDAVVWRDGVASALPDLGGWGFAHAANDAGEVVGEATRSERGGSGQAVLWRGGRVTELGALPGHTASVATDINASGQIVGTSSYFGWEGPGSARGVLFSGGRVLDLNDLVAEHDALISEALRISDSGVIAVLLRGPELRPALLVPTGAPPKPDAAWRSKGTVLAEAELASALALDAERVYWVSRKAEGGLVIKTVPKDGGAVTTLWSADTGFGYGYLAVDEQFVWFDYLPCADSRCDSSPRGIWRVAKSGGPAQHMVEGDSLFALGGDCVYSTRQSAQYPTPPEDLIATPRTGGEPVLLAGAEFQGSLAARDGKVYFVEGVQMGNFHLRQLSVVADGKKTVLVSPSLEGATADLGYTLALDDRSLFFDAASGLLRIPLEGGAPETVAPGVRGGGLEASAGSLFWTQQPDGKKPGCVAHVSAKGGTPACLDSGYWRYVSARADEHFVYFLRDLQIVRMPR
ncbi:hypothetical protein FGE12_05690 [Aggregicoccus sp. 17bor-14]|uniref:hypothetical protein n=1 Tax=Myxococcaceae TaxID=31 RepID=UPI00129CEB87|nr:MULTISPECIES: hypothetical protein [Myxococcaceae]MBF5041875.1 hypothetical protein [Simulacricoccus sp. 17bor-14]MRI87656.1 hypothetical protein [Aggregicoccus sp. 17bor-14]